MRYELLTKEQFELLHFEFAQFLAAQEIDKKQWDRIKETNDKIVQHQMETFSDLVWENGLKKVRFLVRYDQQSLNLFKCGDAFLQRIVVKVTATGIDLRERSGIEWVLQHLKSDEVSCYFGRKAYELSRATMLFQLIKQGSVMTDESLYQAIETQIS